MVTREIAWLTRRSGRHQQLVGSLGANTRGIFTVSCVDYSVYQDLGNVSVEIKRRRREMLCKPEWGLIGGG
jgi:hypothetical protein